MRTIPDGATHYDTVFGTFYKVDENKAFYYSAIHQSWYALDLALLDIDNEQGFITIEQYKLNANKPGLNLTSETKSDNIALMKFEEYFCINEDISKDLLGGFKNPELQKRWNYFRTGFAFGRKFNQEEKQNIPENAEYKYHEFYFKLDESCDISIWSEKSNQWKDCAWVGAFNINLLTKLENQ